jgi:hypothetical protein
MKINEIIREDVSAEEQLGNPGASNLVPVLMFLRKRSEDKGITPKLRTNSLIQLVQNAGDTSFSYTTLAAAYEEDEAVKELIADFNQDEVTLSTELDSAEEMHNDAEEGQERDPQQVVASMAKKARDNRE